MYSWRSGDKDDFACCRRSPGGLPQDCASYSRHRCSCSGNSVRWNSSGVAGTTNRSLGCNGYWLSFSLHSSTWDIKQPRVENVQSSTSISCLYRMWYCVLLRRERQEDLFTVWKNFPAVLQLAATPTSPISEVCMERLWTFRHLDVRQNK